MTFGLIIRKFVFQTCAFGKIFHRGVIIGQALKNLIFSGHVRSKIEKRVCFYVKNPERRGKL